MALKTITGQLVDAQNNGIKGELRFVISQAVTLGGSDVMQSPILVETDNLGNFSLQLQANNDLTPSGTYYTVTENPVNGSQANPYTIVVPQTAGPFQMPSLRVVPPPIPSPTGAVDALVVHLAGTEVVTGSKFFTSGFPERDLGAYAKCDGNIVGDVSTNSSPSTTITSASGLFKATDVGKIFDLFSLASLSTPATTGTITGYISPTQIQISVAVGGGLTNLFFIWASDDTAGVQAWVNAGGGSMNGGFAMIKGTITCPAPNALTGVGFTVNYGGGSIWVSAAMGSTVAFDCSLLLNAKLKGLTFSASPGYTGRVIQMVTANEAGSDFTFRDVAVTSFDQSNHDYLCFLYAAVGTLERCKFVHLYPNVLNLKAFAHTAVISACTAVDCEFTGRLYVNAQQYSFKNCSPSGPAAVANNSHGDGTGTAQQVNTVSFDCCYMYSSGLSGTDYPCVRSVLATSSGEGANGGAFPLVTIIGGYMIFGGGTGTTQNVVLGNFTASQGSTGMNIDGTGVVQSATSPATTVNMVNVSGGSPPIFLRNVAGNLLSTVTTARLLLNSGAGFPELITDFIPSGQTTPWLHPTVSTLTPALTQWPQNSGVGARNTGATAYEVFFQEQAASPITLIELSSDGTTYVTIWSGTGSIVVPKIFRWPAGVYLRLTFASTKPNYIVVPCP